MGQTSKVGTASATRIVDNSVLANRTSKLQNKKTGGSRFAILSEYNDGEPSGQDSQRYEGTQAVVSSEALQEISNTSSTGRRQLKVSTNRYLVVKPTAKNTSKLSKDLSTDKGTMKRDKGVAKNRIQPVIVHQEGMVEDLDDSEVLQSLHKDLVEVENAGMISSVNLHTIPIVNTQQVDVAGMLPFDEVASKLKEAMSMTLE